MADVALPAHHELLLPTLRVLEALGGSGTINEIVDKMVELEGFTEEQQSVLHGDGPSSEIGYRAAWARTYLKKVGAVDNSARGVWAITTRAAISERRTCLTCCARRATSTGTRRGSTARIEESPGDEELEDAWREKVLEAIIAAPADAFERLAQRLLREADFVSVTVTGRSGDQGIDGPASTACRSFGFLVCFQPTGR